MAGEGVAVGFDVGGSFIRGIVLRPDGGLGRTIKRRRPQAPADLVELLAVATLELGDTEDAPVSAIGVGCAGVVDNAGVVRTSPNIPTLIRFPLKAELDARLGMNSVVDNDATFAAWAETQLGAARGADDVALVALGTGLGTGFVLGGRLHRGTSGFAGEAGHMTVVHGGIPCVCGRQGCWERYASGTAFRRLSQEAAAAGRADSLLTLAGGAVDAVTGEHAARLVASGDEAGLAILADLAHWVAVGLGNLAAILDPAVIVIGGGIAELGTPLIDAVRSAYSEVMVDAELRDPITIELAHFRGEAGAVGAALAAAGGV